ncbi:MAG: hypothetical protein ACK4IK_01675 [Bacteroidia bacterium]
MTNNKLFNENSFYWILPAILLLTFLIHTQLFSFSYTDNKLVSAYIVNALLAITIYVVINIIIKNKPEIAGFVFMGGSGIKFIFFFLFFYPAYKQDGQISKLEFLSFFIPYTICLITEVYFLIQRLKQ